MEAPALRAGTRPIHLAVANGHIEVVRALVKAGAEVNNPDVGTAGATALMYAAASVSNGATSEGRLERQMEMMSVLVEAGASLDDISNEGRVNESHSIPSSLPLPINTSPTFATLFVHTRHRPRCTALCSLLGPERSL